MQCHKSGEKHCMKTLSKLTFALLAFALITPIVSAQDKYKGEDGYIIVVSNPCQDAKEMAYHNYEALFDDVANGGVQQLENFFKMGRRCNRLFEYTGESKFIGMFDAPGRNDGVKFAHIEPIIKETKNPFYYVADKNGNNLFHVMKNMKQLKVILDGIENDDSRISWLGHRKNKQGQTAVDVKLREGDKILWGQYKWLSRHGWGRIQMSLSGGIEAWTPEELPYFFDWDKECAKNADCVKNYTANAEVPFGEEFEKYFNEQMTANTETELPSIDLSDFMPVKTYTGLQPYGS